MKDDGSCSCWLVAVGASFVGLLMLCTMLNGGLAGNGEWLDTTTDVGVMESYDAIFESNNAVAASSNCDVAADVVDDGGGCIGGGDTDRDIVGHVGSGTELVQDPTPKSLRKLSRRKRFVAFPEGSSFSVAFCMTVGFIGNPYYTYISWSMNWGVAYDLPNETWYRDRLHGRRPPPPRPVIVRRHRRDLYQRIETIIDNMGYAGKQCVLRALCDSSQYFSSQKSNLAVEMVKTIFSMPRTKVLPFEHPDLVAYDEAHRRGRNRANCAALFPKCTLSLLDFALGEYMRSNNWFQ